MRSQRSPLSHALTSMAFLLGLVYFSYHAVSGENGLTAMVKLSEELSTTQHELDEIRAQRVALDYKVSLLRSESLDLDLLDEQARRLLGYVHPDEMVYQRSEDPTL